MPEDITDWSAVDLDELGRFAYADDPDVEFIDPEPDENPEHGVNSDEEMTG